MLGRSLPCTHIQSHTLFWRSVAFENTNKVRSFFVLKGVSPFRASDHIRHIDGYNVPLTFKKAPHNNLKASKLHRFV